MSVAPSCLSKEDISLLESFVMMFRLLAKTIPSHRWNADELQKVIDKLKSAEALRLRDQERDLRISRELAKLNETGELKVSLSELEFDLAPL